MMLTSVRRGRLPHRRDPVRGDGALDLPGLDRLVDWYLERGVDGLTILGQLGEAPKLTSTSPWRSPAASWPG